MRKNALMMFVLGCMTMAMLATQAAADWPTYRGDGRRSGVTAGRIELPLEAAWEYRPAQGPAPAWVEPGKELHRLDFDYTFQPVAADGVVCFASSADDTIRALDAESGKLLWRFTAGGPIRFAPNLARGNVYLTSDDGYVYCLDIKTGRTVWRFHAAPKYDRIIGNQRMVSRWPCRTDALVVGDTVYCTAGMWSTEGVFIYALDADTGKELWCNDGSGNIYIDLPHPVATGFSGVAPQGYLAVADDMLLVPNGRSVPAAFDRHTGRLLYYKAAISTYDGGSPVTVAGDLFFNPLSRFQNPSQAFVGEAQPINRDGMIAYSLISGEREFVLRERYHVLVDGDALYGVGIGVVEKLNLGARRRGEPTKKVVKWTSPHEPRVYCLVKAGDTILTGNAGSISAFNATDGKQNWNAQVDGQVRGLAIAGGRLIASTNKGEIVCFQPASGEKVEMENVVEQSAPAAADTDQSNLAKRIVARSGKRAGYALMIGEPDSRLAEALARNSELHVVSVQQSKAAAAQERQRLLAAGLNGRRVAVDGPADLAKLPYSPYFADLVVVSAKAKGVSPEECYRVLRPCGGTMCLVAFDEPARLSFLKDAGVPSGELAQGGRMIVRGKLPGAGDWPYAWADGGRTGIGAESRVKMPLDVLWFGGPGPDRLMDRHLMTSPPLSVAGRVFLTGQNDVIAFDAYNGRELWARPVEGVGRKYAQYYSSNFVCDDNSVYVAVGDRCLRLDQASGKLLREYPIPADVKKGTAPPVVPKYIDIQWPKSWLAVGPFPQGKPPLSRKQLETLPEKLTIDGKPHKAVRLEAANGLIDFTVPFGGYDLDGPKPRLMPPANPRRSRITDITRSGQIAYAFAKINCPQDGKLLVGAGADWWMQWFLDGRPVFDTLKGGNSAGAHALFTRNPCSTKDYLFDVDVTAGEHVLAVMVKSGSRGWSLASASRGADAGNVVTVPPDDPNLPDLKNMKWGYISVAGDLLLGSQNVPIAKGQSEESQLIWRSESKAVFAIDKSDGTLRWVYRPKPGRTVSNIEIAHGDGRLFLLDATSKADSVKAVRRGMKPEIKLDLVALNMADGRELWRQPDVPVLRDRSTPTRLKSNLTHLFMGMPNWGHLLYSDGVVALAANAAYDAQTGKKLWEQRVRPRKLPLIHGDWIIAQPRAYELRTGKLRTTRDMLTGAKVPWSYVTAYGCGPTAGCRNLLFFRSGADGFFDMRAEGTTTFGSVRSGCSRTLVAANGLMIHPVGYSGCVCAYSFQTSLALVPASGPNDTWYVFPRRASTGPLKQISLNLGAPGDRRDGQGTAWLGLPRPIMTGACTAPIAIIMENSTHYHHPRKEASIKGSDRPWLYTSGVQGQGTITVGLSLEPNLIVPVADSGPTVDGKLDDACWKKVEPVPLENTPFTLLATNVDLRVFRDAKNLYFGYHRKPIANARPDADEQSLGTADAFEIFVADKKRRRGIRFSLKRGGETFARFGNVDRYRKVDPRWQGVWHHAINRSADQWTAEVAVPLATLSDVGIDVDQMQLNCMSLNLTQSGLESIFLTDPAYGVDFRRCVRFRKVAAPSPKQPKPRKFDIALHFSELDDIQPGQRVFDVTIQGQEVLDRFDVAKESGGRNRPVVKRFGPIEAARQIAIGLSPSPSATSKLPPVISAIEVREVE